jgi:hypothetical protein
LIERPSVEIMARSLGLNVKLLWTRCCRPQRMPGLWRLKSWPPKDLTIPAKWTPAGSRPITGTPT